MIWMYFESTNFESTIVCLSTLVHSERPKLYIILAFLSAIGFMSKKKSPLKCMPSLPFSFLDEQFDQNGEKKVEGRE